MSTSSSQLREYAAIRPSTDADAERRGGGGEPEHGDAAVQEAAQHVAAERIGAECRLAAGQAVRRGYELCRRVGRDQRPQQRDQHDHADDRDADAGAPEPQRVGHEGKAPARRHPLDVWGLPEGEVDRAVDGLVGHRPAVLSFGVTRIVATSASRLSPT
jgi:hypothetical protein